MKEVRDKVETATLKEKTDMKIRAAISALIASAASIGGIATLMSTA